MELSNAKISTDCVIKSINIDDEKMKFRLMELGVIVGAKIRVERKSILKKTLLVVFNNSCFTLKENFAKKIKVHYV